VISLKPTNLLRNAGPDVGKVLLNEMRERSDGFFFVGTERRNTFNFALSIPNFSLESAILRRTFMRVNQSWLRSMSEMATHHLRRVPAS
jgi:hypothetical protein